MVYYFIHFEIKKLISTVFGNLNNKELSDN